MPGCWRAQANRRITASEWSNVATDALGGQAVVPGEKQYISCGYLGGRLQLADHAGRVNGCPDGSATAGEGARA